MKKSLFAALIILNVSLAAFAQTAPPLETILDEAQKQTEFYRETFRDLLAEETKVFTEYDKNGNVEKTTSVKSNFLVYQSGKNVSATAELRNVFEVNGKSVPNGQQRAERFLAELEKAETLEKELKKIQSEGSRYDKTWEIYGLTLNQAVTLSPKMRPYFDYKLLGTENLQGSEVYVVAYQQTKKSPYTIFNEKDDPTNRESISFNLDVPGALKKNDKFLRGKFWIDARTFQLWREEMELTVQTPEPVVLLSTVFEYQPSEYEILIPRKITVVSNELKREKGGERYLAFKDSTVDLNYSRFRKANVEVRILDDENE
jgi:hypothetical protein